MNILVVTSPRTAGTYFLEKFLPEQYVGHTVYNYNELFDFNKQTLLDIEYFDNTENRPTVPLPPQNYLEKCFQFWENLHQHSNDVHAVKLFRNHFHGQRPLEFANSVKRIVKSSDKLYVLYRRDLTETVYSLYYAFTTKNYYVRHKENNEEIQVDAAIWRRLEQSVLANYEFMLNFAKRHGAEVVCKETDLPQHPYQTNHVFSDNSLVCDKSEYYHEEFQKLKL